MRGAALNISSETATNELLKLLVDFVVVADYFLLDAECHVAVLERLRSCLSGGTRRRWPEFVEAVEYAYGIHLADSETPRLMDARNVLVSDFIVLATLSIRACPPKLCRRLWFCQGTGKMLSPANTQGSSITLITTTNV